MTIIRLGKVIPGKKREFDLDELKAKASLSLLAQSLIDTPLRARIIPRAVPHVVVPITATFAMHNALYYKFSACWPNFLSVPFINLEILSLCWNIISSELIMLKTKISGGIPFVR